MIPSLDVTYFQMETGAVGAAELGVELAVVVHSVLHHHLASLTSVDEVVYDELEQN